MSKAKALPQYVAGLSAAFGAFCMGSTIGWSAPVESALMNGDYGFEVSPDNFGWLSSLLTLGAAFVCVPIGLLINAIGRKPSMLVLIPPYMVGWLLLIFAKNVTMLMFGRFILGMCGGAFCVTAPMYTTEIAQLALRGTLGAFFQLLIVSGVLYSYILGAFLNLNLHNILCAILPLIFAVAFIFMPESPVYLAQKGRDEDAGKALAWLRGKNYDTSQELDAMLDDVKLQQEQKINIWAALKRKVTLKGLVICFALQIFQQWTGINAILFYASSIFEDAGTGFSPAISTIIIGAVMVAATFLSVLIIGRVGRRILLMLSAFFMAISTALMGVYFQISESNAELAASLGWLPVSSICIFIIFFSIGFGPLPWVINAELFSEDVKSFAAALSGSVNWLMAFMVTRLFPIFRDSFGPAPTFWIFTVVALLASLYCLLIVPETKGKTLAEIQQMLAGNDADDLEEEMPKN